MGDVFVKISTSGNLVSLGIEHHWHKRIMDYDFAENMTGMLSDSGKFASEFVHKKVWIRVRNLNTKKMIDFIEQSVTAKNMSKGTAIGRRDTSPFGNAARVIKEGIPDGVSVSSHIVFYWSKSDLIQYILKVDRELANYQPA